MEVEVGKGVGMGWGWGEFPKLNTKDCLRQVGIKMGTQGEEGEGRGGRKREEGGKEGEEGVRERREERGRDSEMYVIWLWKDKHTTWVIGTERL